MKAKPPDDVIAEYSMQHPDEEFWILSGHPTEDGLTLLVAAETANIAAFVQYFADTPKVISYEVLDVEHQGGLIEFTVPEPELHQATLSSGNLPTYPLVVRDGWAISEMITSHNRLSELKQAFEKHDLPFDITSLTQSFDPTTLLTDKQREFVVAAITQGYYEQPRRCSLTELAESMDVSKSTASRILHRAEGKIITQFIGDPVT
ncbi:helix-turn-helix domain-containing protein [Haladaptatus salinisoli]|uniref:helix-turn-helix domain-containing protein n=1 Tax=Haladaptatus salinisoli TaxID=2884876 RepID=UPI001D09CF78|nr:helix-turn-helix domain-containing protein [Haladaptatus salinisoli]